MSANQRRVLSPPQLNDADEQILEFMDRVGGRVTPTWIAEEQGLSRTYTSQRLKRLREHGHVEQPFRGLWTLVDDPREKPESEGATPGANAGETEIAGVSEAVEYAKRAEPVSRADLVERFHGAENSRKEKAWWENYARPALRQAGFEFERNVGWER